MIIEITIENYRSISTAQTVSFVAEAAPRHEENLISRPGYHLLKAAALFGANASGKSNLVKAIKAMQAFVVESATRMNEGDPIIAAEPYRLDSKQRSSPSSFAIKFLTGGLVYEYGFKVSTERVHAEWMSGQPETGRKEVLGFERQYDASTGQYTLSCRGLLKPEEELLRKRTRDNALVLSVGARENVERLLSPYLHFRNSIRVLDMSEGEEALQRQTVERCLGDKQFRNHVERLLRDADTGIEGFRIESGIALRNPIVNIGFGLRSATRIITVHRGSDSELVEFDFDASASRGTQRLFALAAPLLDALSEGACVVVDEIDSSMHPLLTRRLLELFQSQEASQNGAQLLLTTHDPALFDQELFRRDQIWLAEKRKGSSEFFSLADIDPKPRNTEAFLRNYLAGHYGGTPSLGRLFEVETIGSVQ